MKWENNDFITFVLGKAGDSNFADIIKIATMFS